MTAEGDCHLKKSEGGFPALMIVPWLVRKENLDVLGSLHI